MATEESTTTAAAETLSAALFDIQMADSMVTTSIAALRRQDCDIDADVADTLEAGAWQAIDRVRAAIERASHVIGLALDLTNSIAAPSAALPREQRDAGGDIDKEDPVDIRAEEDAANIRTFLAGAKPLEGSCYCDHDGFHAGRGQVERLALALERGDESLAPSAWGCVEILVFLTCIQPVKQEHCFGCGGGREQCGLNNVLNHVRMHLSQLTEGKAS